jgi:hypothetical protein
MKLIQLALEEMTGLGAVLTSLAFVRLVKMVSPQNRAVYMVLGVPPWRQLTTSDVYNKTAILVWQ